MDNRLATSAVRLDDWALARSLLESALERARALGSTYLENEAIGFLAAVEKHDGNTERALELARRYVELSRQIGFLYFEANALNDVAELCVELGRLDEAEEHAVAGLELSLRMEDRQFAVYALGLLALTAKARGGMSAGIGLNYNSQNWRYDAQGTWNYGRDVGYGYGVKLGPGSMQLF